MIFEISEKDSILQEIREKRRINRYHEAKITILKNYIMKNQIKIVKLEEKLRNIK
jgi:hypothetical protein